MFGRLGFFELIVILVLALIIFGPGKLPDVGKALGKTIKEFKKASVNEEKSTETDDKSADQSSK